ncbi:MAG: DUF288 domain-containing protein [Acidobacteriaceae bacterium]|nr:DUF288 domain-containing protein [Acidobacteriaceae bacterium]
MHNKTSVVITSISAPNAVLKSIAQGCIERNFDFYVIGDVPSPADFSLPGCEFYSLTRQVQTGFRFAELCPKRHYARKNIGYLLSIQNGAGVIVETDDDNFPLPEFWAPRHRHRSAQVVETPGWVNVYAYFSDVNIWPRGLPLDMVQAKPPARETLTARLVDAPIQQGLADENPDVDAIYRLILPLPVKFQRAPEIALAPGVWSPFNSQNTTWWPDAFPLLYLPAYCTFRMTDIWRSLVAQRIGWENGWHLIFEAPTVWQERNDHNLMRDFKDEVPGYLNNSAIADKLAPLSIRPGLEHIPDNIRLCYEVLVRESYVGPEESRLLDAWLDDLRQIQSGMHLVEASART